MKTRTFSFLFLASILFLQFLLLAPTPIADASAPADCNWHWAPIESPNRPIPGVANRIAVRNSNDVWVAGTDAWHWNGSNWHVALQSSQEPFRDIAAVGKNRVYVLGKQVQFFNGKRWRQLGKLKLDGNIPSAIAVISKKNIWVAIHSIYGNRSTYFRRWDGTKWNRIHNPLPDQVYALRAFGPKNIWAAGNDVYHWNGKSWDPAGVGVTDSQFHRIKVISSDDIWAVGSAGYSQVTSIPVPLALHWDGSQWTRLPEVYALDEYFDSIVPLAANDVWLHTASRVWHWDGATWTNPTVGPPSNGSLTFGDITADDSNHLWVVGNFNGDNAWAQRQDGSAWDNFDLLDLRSGSTHLSAATVLSPDDIWVAGSYGGNLALLAHWNGADWAFPDLGHQPGPVTGISAVNANDIWVVGTSGLFGNVPLLLHYDAIQWSKFDSPSNQGMSLTDVAAVSHNDVWAVGRIEFHNNVAPPQSAPTPLDPQFFVWFPLILHWDGNSWTNSSVLQSDEYTTLESIVAVSASDVWALGSRTDGGSNTLLHWEASSWNAIVGPQQDGAVYFYKLIVAAQNNMWAVGSASYAEATAAVTAHWDGQVWQTFEDTSVLGVRDAVALPSGELWGVGWQGTHSFVGKWNGSNWDKYWTSDQDSNLYRISVLSPTTMWAVGDRDNKSLIVRGICK